MGFTIYIHYRHFHRYRCVKRTVSKVVFHNDGGTRDGSFVVYPEQRKVEKERERHRDTSENKIPSPRNRPPPPDQSEKYKEGLEREWISKNSEVLKFWFRPF